MYSFKADYISGKKGGISIANKKKDNNKRFGTPLRESTYFPVSAEPNHKVSLKNHHGTYEENNFSIWWD